MIYETIKYSLIGSHKAGIEIHPKLDVKSMGCDVLGFEGAPLGDCVFMLVDKLPDPLPNYIEVSNYKLNQPSSYSVPFDQIKSISWGTDGSITLDKK